MQLSLCSSPQQRTVKWSSRGTSGIQERAPTARRRSFACRRHRLRGRVPAGAEGARQPSDGNPQASVEEAAAAVEAVVRLFSAGDLDSVIDFLPDEVLDRAIQRKRAKLEDAGGSPEPEELNCAFTDLLDGARPSDLTMDSYALRALVLAPPAAAAALSSLRLGPERFVQRYAVTAASGEQSVLTFDMQLQEAVVPHYRSLRLTKSWFLRGITGEPLQPDPPTGPGPAHGPEGVVRAQLAALQACNAAGVWAFAAPANQAATGPLERFAAMLAMPPYGILLEHEQAELLRSVQLSRDKALVIVGVTGGVPSIGGQVLRWSERQQQQQQPVKQKAVFCWDLGLQAAGAGERANCWLTEAVRPISGEAAQLVRF